MPIKPDRAAYTALDFRDWRDAGKLILAPDFQRRSVWTLPKKSYLIDTVIRGLPIPPIYIRVRQSEDGTKTVREVIDGQQRVTALLEFLANSFAISKALDAPWAGKKFSSLEKAEADAFREYSFACESFQGISDANVLEIFARLNTYSVQLNNQELRNGSFFGMFKQSVYRLGHEYLDFWRNRGIVSQQGIARMGEAELVSELLIAQIAGMQDKKASIDDFYEKYDESFPQRSIQEQRFRATIDALNTAMGDALAETRFTRLPLFYTLYVVTFHKMFGLPEAPTSVPGTTGKLSQSDRDSLRDAVLKASAVLDAGKAGENLSKSAKLFYIAAQGQTDNLKPRQERFKFLYAAAFR